MKENEETPSSGLVTEAPKHKTAIGKIIAGAEKPFISAAVFVGKEAGIIAKLFTAEEPKLQNDLKTVSGIIQILKVDTAETPDVLVYAIKKAYPGFDLGQLQVFLTSAANDLNIAVDTLEPTLTGTISAIQAHIPTLKTDGAHKSFWTGLFNLVGQLISPGTPWSKIVVFGVFIYNNFVKPKA